MLTVPQYEHCKRGNSASATPKMQHVYCSNCPLTIPCRFSFDAMLELQGNTAVYLLYAHARIAAIGRKAGIEDIAALAQDHSVHIEHEKERALALHVSVLWLAVAADRRHKFGL